MIVALALGFGLPALLALFGFLSRMKFDATTLLSAMLAFAFLIPAKLSVANLGGAATPAVIAGLLMGGVWVLGRLVPSVGFASGAQPIRAGAMAFGWVMIASWGATFLHPSLGVEIRAADRGFLTILSMLGVLLFAADGLVSCERIEILLKRLVALGGIIGVIAILQFTTNFNYAASVKVPGLGEGRDGTIQVGQRSDFKRVAATTLHPIEFGVTLVMIMPIAIHFALQGKTRAEKQWTGLCAALMFCSIPMSISRSAFVGAAGAAVVMFPIWHWRRQINAGFVLAVGLVAMRLTFPGLLGTIRSLFTSIFVDTSITHRTDYAESVGDFVRQSPFFGRGLHTYLPELYSTFDNQYLLTLVESGIIGLIALVGLWVASFVVARKAASAASDYDRKHLAVCLSGALTVPFLTSATFDFLSFPVTSAVAFLLMGVAGALLRLNRAEQSAASSTELANVA